MMIESFDFQYLYELLVSATRQAFLSIQQRHQGERLYSFALYTTGDFVYVSPTASTEEGLTQFAQKYVAKDHDHTLNLEEQRLMLRWSPADSPLHLEGSEYFTEIDTIFETANMIANALYDEEHDSWEAYDAFKQHIQETFIVALQELDREGLFGRDEQREAITINLLMGDQSDESRIQNAQKLNPPIVWQRLATELEAREALWK